MVLSQGYKVGETGLVTFLPQDTELWPLLCGEQHCQRVTMFLWFPHSVTAPGQLQQLLAVLFQCQQWWLVIVSSGRMSTTTGPAWLKNILKSRFLLWNPGLRTTGLYPASVVHTVFAWFEGWTFHLLWSRSFLRWITADPSPWRNFTQPTKHECGENLGYLEPVYDLFPIMHEFALPEAVTQTRIRRLGGTGPVEKVVTFTVNHRGTFTSRERNR